MKILSNGQFYRMLFNVLNQDSLEYAIGIAVIFP